uniref:Glycosyltransferase-like protein LARGE2 n=1 Tax=Plectus sambesii TaxID=2011161 RepID=A0A914WFW9_9BILA
MDGSLLRKEMLRCSNVSTEATESADAYEYDDDEDGCGEVRRARSTLYRTHLFIRTFSMEERPADVTLVTQLSMDRLQMLEQLLSQWEGPVSVALYLSDSETNQLLRFAADSPHIAHRTNVAFHIVYKQGSLYPVNYLRNVALNASMTPFVYLADVDFLPMFGLYDVLRQAVVAQGSMQNKAMVVPAFEAHGYRSPFPRSKAELINQLDAGRLIVFRQDVWAKGHVPTDYDRWRSAAAPYSVGWQPDYEPYVVVGRHVPKYDPRFLGFGWNKVSHIMLLDALGYDFVVLPNAFIVHQPHAPSFEIAKYRSSPVYRRCLKALKGEFVRDLAKMQNARRRAGRIVPAFDNNATESLFIASDTVIRNRRSNRRR